VSPRRCVPFFFFFLLLLGLSLPIDVSSSLLSFTFYIHWGRYDRGVHERGGIIYYSLLPNLLLANLYTPDGGIAQQLSYVTSKPNDIP